MFKNYLRSAWRNLKSGRFYSLINISGLAIGMATAIMLLLWVRDELSYDKFHTNYENIYRISAHFKSGGNEVSWEGVPGPLAVFARSMPQVRSLVRINDDQGQVLADRTRHKILDGNHTAFVDSSFFSLFDFRLLKGNRTHLFPNSNSVVVTRTLAQKLFGTDNALGKVLNFQDNNFSVTGILEDFPENSSLQFDALFPMSFYAQRFTSYGGNGDWKTIDQDLGNYAFQAYIMLGEGSDPIATGRQFTSAYKKARNGDSEVIFKLQNLASIHLVGVDGNNAAQRMVQIFLLVAILLLAIAAINYINLSTARSLIRGQEISIRKIIGANRRQLFFQFVTETLLLFCLAAGAAIILIIIFMPLYNRLSGKTLHFSLADMQVWSIIGWSVLSTLAAASVYPALLLSSFRPLEALKGKITSGVGAGLFRKILVIFQFTISIILIIGTLVISHQMKFIQQKDLGYDKSYVFTVQLNSQVVDHIDAVKNELKKQSGVLNVSLSDIYDLSAFGNASSDLVWQGKPENSRIMIGQAIIDQDFIPTMKIQFVEGGNFSGTPADSTRYILNQTAVEEMGLTPPYVGQSISFHGHAGTIIGVVKDFNFKSLREKISPLLFFTWGWKGSVLYVRTTGKDAPQAIAAVKKQYKRYAGDLPFSYSFVDQQFEEKYRSDQRAGLLFNLFAAMAIFISCLGLLGLATYTAQVRTKEIGIRKVLGASIVSLVRLLSTDFITLVLLAIILAVPVAWYGMNKWLEDFAYRIQIHWWMFGIAGGIAMLIALITISFRAIKSALANPIDNLRTE